MVRGYIVIIIGILLAVIAAACFPLLHWIIKKQVLKKVVIANNSDSEFYPIWADPSLLPDVYLQVYPLNITNPDEVLMGQKPIMKQMGPYTYREFRRKENIQFNENGTVSYIERRWFEFDRNKSAGALTDKFTLINIPLVALAEWIRYIPSYQQRIVDLLLRHFENEPVFIQKGVNETVFGYHDKMLHFAMKHLPFYHFNTDVVGILTGKNYSYDGVFTVFTGVDNIDDIGVIDKFNGSQYLKFWSTKYANMVNGSADGAVNKPFISKDYVARMFSMDICRSVYATYYGETHDEHNVKMYRFRAPKKAFENKELNPDNAGFCTPLNNCMGTGVMNLSTCQIVDGIHVPVVISFPHFYLAEKQYIDNIIGLNQSGQYATEIDIEPTTGLVMFATKRIQMNIKVQPNENFKNLKKLRNMVLPVMWLNESVKIDSKHALMVKHELIVPQFIAHVCQYVFIGIGALLVLTGVFLEARSALAQKKQSEQNADNGPSTSVNGAAGGSDDQAGSDGEKEEEPEDVTPDTQPIIA